MGVLAFTDCIPTCASGSPPAANPNTLFVDSARRQLLALQPGQQRVYMADADSLKQTGAFDVSVAAAKNRTIAFDARHRRLFFGDAGTPVSCGTKLECQTRVPTIVAVPVGGGPEQTFTFATPAMTGRSVVSLAYDERREVLFALTNLTTGQLSTPPLVSETTLFAIDARNLSQPAWSWSYPVEHCPRPTVSRAGQLGIGTTGDFVYFACQGVSVEEGTLTKATVQPTLSGVIRVNFQGTDVATQVPGGLTTELHPFLGSLGTGFAFVDQAGDRISLVKTGLETKMFVFDARHRSWTGAIPLGYKNMFGGVADVLTGRLYVTDEEVGLAVSDGAALPITQGHKYPIAASPLLHPSFDPPTRRLFVPTIGSGNEHFRVYEDRTPALRSVPVPSADERTNDIDEDLANQVSYTGGASGFGARALLVGGLRETQLGVAGPIIARGDQRLAPEGGDRGLFLGRVTSTEMTGDRTDPGQARAQAVGASLDAATESDLEGKLGMLPNQLGQDAPPGLTWAGVRGMVGEFGASRCGDYGDAADRRTDSRPGSAASCQRSKVTSADASFSDRLTTPQLRVAYASADTETLKVDRAGARSRSTSAARGIHIEIPGSGSLDIGEVRSVAESWAAGRPGTAGSSYKVTIENFAITDAAGKTTELCTSCDPRQVAAEINKRFTQKIHARSGVRDADPAKAGSPGGAQAVVIKDPYALWNDINIQGDSQPEVSGLQLVIYNDGQNASRIVVQLAAVFTQAIYLIGAPKPPVVVDPTKLVVKLVDDVGAELPGGVFEVRPAGTEQGALAAVESELAGTCVTDDDGIGDCTFDDLPPGDYDITQVTAPTGYATAEGTTVTLAPGYRTDVVFTNLRAIGSIALTLTDDGEEPEPLAGAAFSVYADDGDLVLGDGDQFYDQCTTGDDGGCTFEEVPLGAYVVTQTAAPAEHLTADDVGFVLEAPGQVANLSFVTGLTPIPPTPGTPGTEAEEIVEDEPVVTASVDAPTETTTVVVTSPPTQPIAQVTQTPLPTGGGGVRRLLALPADTLGYLARRPLQALLFGLLWALLGAPLYLALRRRSLTLVKAVA